LISDRCKIRFFSSALGTLKRPARRSPKKQQTEKRKTAIQATDSRNLQTG